MVHHGYEVDVQDDKGQSLVSSFNTTMTVDTEEDIFAVVKFTMRKGKQDPADLMFNYKSIAHATVTEFDSKEYQAVCKLPSVSGQQPDFKLVLHYDFMFTASTKLHLDSGLRGLVNYMNTGEPLTIFFCGLKSPLHMVLEKLKAEKRDDPLDKSHNFDMEDELVEVNGVPSRRKPYEPRKSFHCHTHYLAVHKGGCEIEQKLFEAKASQFNNRMHQMKIVQMVGCGDRKYQVFFPPGAKNDARLQPGEQLQVLLPGRRDWDTAWGIIVIPSVSYGPAGYLCGHMERPWKSPGKGQDPELGYDRYKLETISYSTPKLETAIVRSKGVAVTLHLKAHDGLLRRRKQCMNYIGAGKFENTMTDAVGKVLLSNHLHDTKSFDIFRNLRSDYDGKPEDYIIGLNQEQQLAVDLGSRAPAGIVLVQGPPGTGKTHLIMAMTAPWILSSKLRKILLTTQTNVGADNLAQLAQEKIDNLAKLHPDRPWVQRRYVVRAHPNEIEMKLLSGNAKKNKVNARPADYRAPAEAQIEMLKIMINARNIVAYLQQCQTDSEASGKRNREVGLSLATRMMEMAGILPTGPKSGNEIVATEFRLSYEKWERSEIMSEKEETRFWESARGLRNHVLRNAAVVCTTVTNAAADFVRTNLADQTDLIIADEMPRCSEADSLMLFMGQFNPSGYLVVGDKDQLGPFVESSSDKENPLTLQLQMSVQERLQEAGLEHIFLKVQHRMDPNLAKDTSTIIYDSRLENHETTKNRELMIRIEEFNEHEFGIKTNKLLLNIPNVSGIAASATRQATNMSRYNDYHVMFSINLAEKISKKLPGATIAIMTGYLAQLHRLKSAKQNMSKQGSSAHISVHNIDTVQGLEFDFVILDNLFLSRGSAGFLRDRRRINVATSRAKHGMFILVDMQAYVSSIAGEGRKSNFYVQEFMERWLEHKKTVDVKELKCNYYHPGMVDAKTGKGF